MIVVPVISLAAVRARRDADARREAEFKKRQQDIADGYKNGGYKIKR